MSRIATVFSALALAFAVQLAPAGAAEVGVWIDDKGEGAVDIAPCGTKLCGKIVWLKQPLDKAGKPLIDDLNPQAAKRKQLVCGLQVLGSLVKQSDGTWDQGWVYDPKVGEAYDLMVQLKDANHLVIIGYKGIKLFGQKFVWTRANQPLPPCAAQPAAAAPAPKT